MTTPIQTTTSSPTQLILNPQHIRLAEGSSATIRFWLNPHPRTEITDFRLENLPAGVETTIKKEIDPWHGNVTLTAKDIAPSTYLVDFAADLDGVPNFRTSIDVTVIPCKESTSGEFTQAIQSHLVDVTYAGKPQWASGLLVPIMICKHERLPHLTVRLKQALSEIQTPMLTPPPFYLYRSLEYPAPPFIYAHPGGSAPNVDLRGFPPVSHSGWQLQADTQPGLYLLIFQYNSYPAIKDPARLVASVTYSIDIQH